MPGFNSSSRNADGAATVMNLTSFSVESQSLHMPHGNVALVQTKAAKWLYMVLSLVSSRRLERPSRQGREDFKSALVDDMPF